MSRMPSVGEIIDDAFRVEAEIDSGNFGSVYKVHDLAGNRKLALKVLRPGPHDESELRRRFEREARLVYSLRHKHIVGVYYYGETNSGLPYMAMEYLVGTDLRTLLKHHGALNSKFIRRITLETLAALHEAHSLGIVHRDLKPANIFLVKDGGKGHVKVLDFGFAKALVDDNAEEITNVGTLVGTPAYMAPELVHKKNVGPAADLYAMGLIIAEMMTGQKVVNIESIYDTIMFQASPKRMKLSNEIEKSEFGPTIKKAIAKGLAQRYKSAAEMAESLGGLPEVAPRITVRNNVELSTPQRIPRDTGDHDVTVPHSRGLPSDQELDRALGRENPRDLAPIELQSKSQTHEPNFVNHRSDFNPTAVQEREIHQTPTRTGFTEVILGALLGFAVLAIIFFFFVYL